MQAPFHIVPGQWVGVMSGPHYHLWRWFQPQKKWDLWRLYKSEFCWIPWSNTIHVVIVIRSDQGSFHNKEKRPLSTELGISEVQPNRLTRTNCWISIRAPDSWASNYGVILLHQTSLVNHSVFLKQRPNIASSNKVPPAVQRPFLPLADVFEV